MPYTRGLLHKRDVLPPLRRSFHLRPAYQDYRTNQSPRYVTSFEYDFNSPHNDQIKKSHWQTTNASYNTTATVGNSNANSKQYTLTTGSAEPVKFNYQRKYFHTPHKTSSSHHNKYTQREKSYDYQGNLQAKIKAPSGTVQYCDITDYDNQHFNVQFNPSEVGEHLISVKSGGSHVPGSPFKIYVDNVAQENVGRANSVQVYGSGLEGGFTNEECEFHVYTHNSGSGKLTVSIDGPSKAVLNLTENENDNYQVRYHVDTRGEYLCSVKLNGDHINGSPFHLYMEDRMPVLNENTFYSANTSNVTLATTQNQGLTVGRQSSFMLHHKGLDGGAFQAYMLTPSGQRYNVDITHVGNGQFTVQLEPKEQGLHFIHVSLDNKPIAGSPFQVLVGEVIAQGTGLYHGQINTANSFQMDAKNTTSGPLTVTIDGPSKVELNCCQSDVDSGLYEFTYIPNVPGEYIISIKYGHNQHIKGSPFKVNITGDSESHRITQNIQQNYVVSAQSHSSPHIAASCNVKCRGEGIRKAYIGRNNEFIIDASNAGNGVPYVAITGPHNPSEEINIRHVGSNRFQVTYFVREYGPHDILVRWGDIEVPGSPFRVYSF